MIKFFNVDKQYQQDREVYLDLVDQVYTTGQVINGPYCRKLEDSLKKRTGRKHCVLTASCTDALAFVGDYLKPKRIYYPNLSFPATNRGFQRTLISPKSHYLQTHNGNLNLDQLRDVLRFDPDATVVFVNLFGHCVDFDQIQELSNRWPQVMFVEDAAQSFGASWDSTPSGSVGIASTISFDPTKNLNAFGIGGAMLTDDDELAKEVDLTRRPHTPKWINRGYNSQINEVDAAIVWWKLENRFDQWQQRRTEIANYYVDNLDVECLQPHKRCTSAWHKFIIWHDNRDRLQADLKEAGVETKVHYKRHLDDTTGVMTDCVLSLPIYAELTDAEVELVVEKVNQLR